MWALLEQNLLKRDIHLQPAEWEMMKLLFVERRYRKNQFILQEGNTAQVETFILKGLTRTYEVDEAGQEHVLFFGCEDWWVGDLYSFLSGAPSKYNIDCLEETETLQITRSNLDRLYEQVPVMNRYFRILLQNAYITLSQRVGSVLSKSALERYQEFLVNYPEIEGRIPNHQIASFLGITPQSLSRIRAQYATGK